MMCRAERPTRTTRTVFPQTLQVNGNATATAILGLTALTALAV